MSESEDKKPILEGQLKTPLKTPNPEKPPATPNELIAEEFLGKVPFSKGIKAFFIREGKAVKEGWLVFVAIVWVCSSLGVAGGLWWKSHSLTPQLDKKDGEIQELNGKIIDAANKLNETQRADEREINQLKGELSSVTQDRDKYQTLLAPYEAYAMAKYTNLPSEERLAELGSTVLAIHNDLMSDKPILGISVNGILITNSASRDDIKLSDCSQIKTETNGEIKIEVQNLSEVTAERVTIDFESSIDPTNVIVEGWSVEPKSEYFNHWHLVSDDSLGTWGRWAVTSIRLLKNGDQKIIFGLFTIHANRSKTFFFPVEFKLNTGN